MYAARPSASSRASTAAASVDLPEAGRPVSQTVAPAWPSAAQRRSRVVWVCCQTTLAERGASAIERVLDHARADGLVGGLVDQDERARRAVGRVGVEVQLRARAQRYAADLVEAERVGAGARLERLHVQRVVDRLQAGALAAR